MKIGMPGKLAKLINRKDKEPDSDTKLSGAISCMLSTDNNIRPHGSANKPGVSLSSPGNVFCLRGNRETLNPHLSKSGIQQWVLFRKALVGRRGARYTALVWDFFGALPVFVKHRWFFAMHGGPVRGGIGRQELVNVAPDKYNSRNDQIVVAIGFLNADLVCEEIKIVGVSKRFGWEKREKTRHLTPLQCRNCLEYDMAFFGMRMKQFKTLTFPFLKEVCRAIFKTDPEGETLSRTIADNLLKRVEYVDGYFRTHIEAAGRDASSKKYREMGKSFPRFYGK